jgi:hypothetical protein
MQASTLGKGIENIQRWEGDPATYHQIQPARVSCSMIKAYAEDPESCWEQYVAGIGHREPSPSMQFGTDFEHLVFTGSLPGHAVLIPSEVLRHDNRDGKTVLVKQGTAWTEFKRRMEGEHGPDVRLLKADEWEKQVTPLLVAQEKARAHDAAAKLLWGEGETHVAYVWDDVSTGVILPCKCQLDILFGSEGTVLVDVKTASQNAMSDRMSIARQINEFKYHWQAWWYTSAHLAMTGRLVPFVFVFVGNKAPHSVQVIELEPEWYDLAEAQVRTYLGRLAQSWESGVWRPQGWGVIQKVKPPKWAITNWEDECWL